MGASIWEVYMEASTREPLYGSLYMWERLYGNLPSVVVLQSTLSQLWSRNAHLIECGLRRTAFAVNIICDSEKAPPAILKNLSPRTPSLSLPCHAALAPPMPVEQASVMH